MMELIELWMIHYGYGAVFVLLMSGIVGLPIPDETVLTLAGYMTYKGHLHLLPAIGSAFLGTTCGITVSYLLGRSGGVYLIQRYGPLIKITTEKVDEVRRWFNRAGRWSLTVGYFIPGIRHLVALVAGASGVTPVVFGLFAYSGGLLWSVSFITAGYYLGKSWHRFSQSAHQVLSLIGIAVVAAFIGYVLLRRRRSREA